MKRRWLRLAAVPAAFALFAAACGDDDTAGTGGDTEAPGDATTSPGTGTEPDGTTEPGDTTPPGDTQPPGTMGSIPVDPALEGTSVTITGSERDDPSVIAINESLKAFGDANGMEITFTGDADWEANINTQVQGGNPPNIGIFPQPGKLGEFARAGNIFPLAEATAEAVGTYWAEDYSNYGLVDDQLFAVPVKTDLKSIVWYQPSVFEAAGFAVPETFDEFTALLDQMKAEGDGRKPLCVGIESGNATGWTFTDWTEEMVLRQQGGDYYDQWVAHEIPFDDPGVAEAMQTVLDVWSEENVFASGGTIAATNFGEPNASALVNGDCYMHRQASFFSGFFPAGTGFADGAEGSIDVFYFPDINGDRPVLTAGTFAAAFDENPETMAVLAYMATPGYAQLRQEIQTRELDGGLSGFLSAAQGQDPAVYQPLEQGFLEILNSADLSRFDASDLMPAEVGVGSFWSEGTSAANGDQDAAEAAANIEDSWP
ncbi:MAG: carbohydrate ABC transporter substrate-binding protein [Acidimicrobiia bacterium]|nr:carbohydrate ABC transporter substrate-binding protein [Acidimicrobiia bacterium]